MVRRRLGRADLSADVVTTGLSHARFSAAVLNTDLSVQGHDARSFQDRLWLMSGFAMALWVFEASVELRTW